MQIKIKKVYSKTNVRPKFLSEGKSHLSLDFYLEKYNIGIECQGIQHFKYCDFFEGREETIFERDKRKFELCKKIMLNFFIFLILKKKIILILYMLIKMIY